MRCVDWSALDCKVEVRRWPQASDQRAMNIYQRVTSSSTGTQCADDRGSKPANNGPLACVRHVSNGPQATSSKSGPLDFHFQLGREERALSTGHHTTTDAARGTGAPCHLQLRPLTSRTSHGIDENVVCAFTVSHWGGSSRARTADPTTTKEPLQLCSQGDEAAGGKGLPRRPGVHPPTW